MAKIYKQPFAHSGDAIVIPSSSQPDGKMSSADGWTPDYQLPKTDPNYKPVGRQEMNGVFKEVTEALGQVQVQGAASWSADGAPYPINAQVYHNGKQWLALRANSVAPTVGADWAAIGTAATANLTTSSTDGTAGRVLRVGDFGFGGNSISRTGLDVNTVNNNGFYYITSGINTPVPNGHLLHIQISSSFGCQEFVGSTEGTSFRKHYRTNSGGVWQPWREILHSANILQTTGTSTTDIMSQKAVSDQLKNREPLKTSIEIESASFGTTYTNTSLGMKFVFVSASNPSGATTQVYSVTVGGEVLFTPGIYGGTAVGGFCFAVPSGFTYRVNVTAGATLTRWMEMF